VASRFGRKLESLAHARVLPSGPSDSRQFDVLKMMPVQAELGPEASVKSCPTHPSASRSASRLDEVEIAAARREPHRRIRTSSDRYAIEWMRSCHSCWGRDRGRCGLRHEVAYLKGPEQTGWAPTCRPPPPCLGRATMARYIGELSDETARRGERLTRNV